MEENKIYVVINEDSFKEFCEEKLGEDITADDYINMEKFKNEKIHLVPHYFPNKYYIRPNSTKYDIYINIQDEWEINNIVNITEDDIEELLDDNSIEDIETHKHWKDILGFKVIDRQSFVESLLPSLTDEEAIRLIKILSRSYKTTSYSFYLIYDKESCNIYIHDNRFNNSYKLPFTTLDKEDLTNLIRQNSIRNINCKINENGKLINFDDNISDIVITPHYSQGIRILKRDDRYIIRDYIRDNYFNPVKHITVVGSTEKEAIHKFRVALTESFLNKDRFGHKDILKTLEMYQHIIESHEDKEF